MCLRINSPTEKPKAKIAKEDIICYKVMMCFNMMLDKEKVLGFRAPFTSTEIELGETYHDKKRFSLTLVTPKEKNSGVSAWDINGGGFYTYAKREDAVGRADCYNSVFSNREGCRVIYVVAYAIIPKGTKYYEGTCDGRTAYVSKNIIYTRNLTWCDSILAERFSIDVTNDNNYSCKIVQTVEELDYN